MVSYSVPSGAQGQNKKGKIKSTPHGISKDRGAPQEILCTKSMGNLKYRDNGKNKRCLHRDAYLRMCVSVCLSFGSNITSFEKI